VMNHHGRRAVGENADRRICRVHWVKDTRQGRTQWFTRPGEQDGASWCKTYQLPHINDMFKHVALEALLLPAFLSAKTPALEIKRNERHHF